MKSFKVIFGALFSFLIVGIAFLVVMVYSENEDSNRQSNWVEHTYEVLDNVDDLASLYKNLQLENVEYLVNGSESSYAFDNIRDVLPVKVEALKGLTNDNPVQKARVDSLKKILNHLIIFSDSLIRTREHLQPSVKSKLIETNYAFNTKIGGFIQSLKSEELRLLKIRKENKEHTSSAFNQSFNLLVGTLTLLLSSAFLLVRYNFNLRMKVQNDLETANELLGKLFNESPVGIVISEIDSGKIIDCNKAYCDLVGRTKQELIGRTAVELGITTQQVHDEISKMIIRNGFVYDHEIEFFSKGNVPVWGSKSIQIIRANNKLCSLSVILNVTSHKKAEEEIKRNLAREIELNTMKSNFVSLASHEFRTPLTAILSSVYLIENYLHADNQEKIIKHLSRIRSSVNTLTSILDEFLSLNKIEEGKIKPFYRQINISEQMERLCRDARTIAKTGQEIIYEHTGNYEVFTDPLILDNIVNNLLSNAIKYSPENSVIQVSTEVNDKLCLKVKDFGIGISPQDQQHLFTRFFRGANATTIQGTGLGLHLMKHYAEILDGSVSFKSEINKGSEFVVCLNVQPSLAETSV